MAQHVKNSGSSCTEVKCLHHDARLVADLLTSQLLLSPNFENSVYTMVYTP